MYMYIYRVELGLHANIFFKPLIIYIKKRLQKRSLFVEWKVSGNVVDKAASIALSESSLFVVGQLTGGMKRASSES